MAQHMLGHIFLMNYLAPLVIVATRAFLFPSSTARSPRWIGVATVVQIAALWLWHLPPAMNWAMETTEGFTLMSVSLAVAALAFWRSVIDCALLAVGRALLSLLVTGKLFCLLGILIAFAPRPIYGLTGHAVEPLNDQQLAGLLMLISCPLTYVLAAVFIAARWLAEVANRPRWQMNGLV